MAATREQTLDAIRVLQVARSILKNRGWCQEHFALDAAGQDVEAESEDAVRFCAEGALVRACHDLKLTWDEHDNDAGMLAEARLNSVSGLGIISLNDAVDTTRDVILSVFDQAIRLAGKDTQ